MRRYVLSAWWAYTERLFVALAANMQRHDDVNMDQSGKRMLWRYVQIVAP